MGKYGNFLFRFNGTLCAGVYVGPFRGGSVAVAVLYAGHIALIAW